MMAQAHLWKLPSESIGTKEVTPRDVSEEEDIVTAVLELEIGAEVLIT